jgi:hypothetical protein
MTDSDDLFEPAQGPAYVATHENPGPIFDAAYASTCEFLDDIQIGDRIQAVGGDSYAHASCLRLSRRPVIWE